MNKEITIQNWSFVTDNDPYRAPELSDFRIQGRKGDNKYIITSNLVGQRNGKILTSTGSIYSLGEVDPDYERAFPNAKVRLMKQLPEK